MSTRSAPPRARESHGRELTTTAEAAILYRTAQQHHRDRSQLIRVLQLAVRADPAFAVAASDLAALDGRLPTPPTRPLRLWERHHIEVVTEAAGNNPRRAADLLRDHLSVVACDPIATAIVLGAPGHEPLDDILDHLANCHHPPK
jgi:hypothetical protein